LKSSLHCPYGIHRWELETLLIQLLLTPKEERRAEGNFVLDCSKFDAIRDTINRLRNLENVQSGRYLGNEAFAVAIVDFRIRRPELVRLLIRPM
jgi:hypothetical protein